MNNNQKKSKNFAYFDQVNDALTRSIQVLEYLDDENKLSKRELEGLHVLENLDELLGRIPLLYDIRVPSPLADDSPGAMICPYAITSDSSLDYIFAQIKFRILFFSVPSSEFAKKIGVSQNYVNLMRRRFYKGEMTPKTIKKWVEKYES